MRFGERIVRLNSLLGCFCELGGKAWEPFLALLGLLVRVSRLEGLDPSMLAGDDRLVDA
jgi:hypothetical protein